MAGEPTFRGERLVALRRMDGLTQADLKDKLGVSQGFISLVEKAARPFPAELAHRAAAEFNVPVEFFAVPPHRSENGIATFRKNSKAPVGHERMVLSTYAEAARLFSCASERSGYIVPDLATATGEDVEETAANYRSMLGLAPNDPIPNATRAVERLGVGVIHDLMGTVEDNSDHHGLSLPTSGYDRPLVATVGTQPAAVARMTVLHELGHLIYDRHLTAPIRSRRGMEETRAFRFAGAMLIPASIMRQRITETLTLHGYLSVKADYGITVGALIKRASDLGIISAQRSRSLFIQLNSQGWRRHEPVTVPTESARLLPQAAQYGISPDPAVISHTVGVRLTQIAQWTGLTPPAAPTNVVPLRPRAQR